jgi:hypothetical protein
MMRHRWAIALVLSCQPWEKIAGPENSLKMKTARLTIYSAGSAAQREHVRLP